MHAASPRFPTHIARLLLVGTVATFAVAALAGAPAQRAEVPANADAQPKSDPRSVIAKRLEVDPASVRPSVLPGIFEVARGAEVLYVSSDGQYALSGDLFVTATGKNLSEKRRIEARQIALRGVSDADAIIFEPKHPRYTVTVFTDVDCTYCRKLHSEIAEYNRLGIRIKYLSFPRTGPNTEAWRKAEVVWCSADRREALTRAKLGGELTGKTDCATPIARSYELGQELGIRGTPGIFTEGGEYLPGYYSPERLVQRLKELEPKAPAG